MYQSLRCTVRPQKISQNGKKGKHTKNISPSWPVVLNQEYALLEVNNDNLVTVGKSGYVPVVKVHARTPKNPKNGKKWQKGLKVQKIYPLVVPNQEFAPLEVKNEKTGTVGKSRSLSGQVLCNSKRQSFTRVYVFCFTDCPPVC